MSNDTTFVNGTVITAGWLNDVNDLVFNGKSLDDISIVNVKDPTYGAVGNGVADDTAAIQAALNAGICYIPAGIYKVSTLVVPANSGIIGAGRQTTYLRASTAANHVIDVTGSYTYFNNFTIDRTIAQTNGYAAIRHTSAGSISTLENIYIATSAIGLLIEGGILQRYTNIDIRDVTQYVIRITGGNDAYFTKVIADNPPGAQPIAGVSVTKTDAIWMTDCDFIHCGNGLELIPQVVGDFITWCFFQNTAWDTCGNNGIFIQPQAGTWVDGTSFSQCWSSTNTVFGVNLDGSLGRVSGTSFNGFRCLNNAESGIVLTGALLDHTLINGSLISGNSTVSPGTWSGVDVGANVNSFTVTNNQIGALASFSNIQARGVLINAGTSNQYTIANNNVIGNTVGILDNGTGTTKSIKDNLGYKNEASGATSVANGGTVTHGLVATPTKVRCTPSVSGEMVSVTALGATTFTVAIIKNDGTAGTTQTIYWEAEV